MDPSFRAKANENFIASLGLNFNYCPEPNVPPATQGFTFYLSNGAIAATNDEPPLFELQTTRTFAMHHLPRMSNFQSQTVLGRDKKAQDNQNTQEFVKRPGQGKRRSSGNLVQKTHSPPPKTVRKELNLESKDCFPDGVKGSGTKESLLSTNVKDAASDIICKIEPQSPALPPYEVPLFKPVQASKTPRAKTGIAKSANPPTKLRSERPVKVSRRTGHPCSYSNCRKTFQRRHDVKRHEESVHKNPNGRGKYKARPPYICQMCRGEFSRNDALRRHQMTSCPTIRDGDQEERSASEEEDQSDEYAAHGGDDDSDADSSSL
ncbi:hypothetical protein GALMADRAFT_139046 [Galerina marginata CBS 339.88]|uniref:C2H2-type domain-containing protein n=1 Tax=Galerina marginata (strain CBS 339.88) TaxID=685588 RepID=A0A067TAW7_GALM3|nr:hypothetical protein GALMADRAFT_139046 [Galerina marginata CBS 339.88]